MSEEMIRRFKGRGGWEEKRKRRLFDHRSEDEKMSSMIGSWGGHDKRSSTGDTQKVLGL